MTLLCFLLSLLLLSCDAWASASELLISCVSSVSGLTRVLCSTSLTIGKRAVVSTALVAITSFLGFPSDAIQTPFRSSFLLNFYIQYSYINQSANVETEILDELAVS